MGTLEIVNITRIPQEQKMIMEIKVDHLIHGNISVEAHILIKSRIKEISFHHFKTEQFLPYDVHKQLVKEFYKNNHLKTFIREQVFNYFTQHHLPNIKAFQVKEFSIVQANTNYIRHSFYVGSDFCYTKEEHEEEHIIHLVIDFEGISEKIEATLSYKKRKKKHSPYEYRILIANHLMREHRIFNWEDYLLLQLLPSIKKQVNFLLP